MVGVVGGGVAEEAVDGALCLFFPFVVGFLGGRKLGIPEDLFSYRVRCDALCRHVVDVLLHCGGDVSPVPIRLSGHSGDLV